MDKCPQCGAANPESGTLMVKGSPTWDIRFFRNGAGVFSFKDQVRAVACRSCGHIALVLAAVVRPSAAGDAQDAEPGPAAGGGRDDGSS